MFLRLLTRYLAWLLLLLLSVSRSSRTASRPAAAKRVQAQAHPSSSSPLPCLCVTDTRGFAVRFACITSKGGRVAARARITRSRLSPYRRIGYPTRELRPPGSTTHGFRLVLFLLFFVVVERRPVSLLAPLLLAARGGASAMLGDHIQDTAALAHVMHAPPTPPMCRYRIQWEARGAEWPPERNSMQSWLL